MKKKATPAEETIEKAAFLVVCIDVFNGRRIFYNAATKQSFRKPDNVFKVAAITEKQAVADCKKANELSTASGWNMVFKVLPFEPYTEDENENPFTSW